MWPSRDLEEVVFVFYLFIIIIFELLTTLTDPVDSWMAGAASRT